MDVDRLRKETPGCHERIHLNNAGAGLMPEPVLRTIIEHLELESRIGGYEAQSAVQPAIDAAYESVGRLVGAPARNIAFTEHATAAYVQALSSIPLAPGDVILTTRHDYVSNQIQFLSMRDRLGVEIIRAPDSPEGGADIEAMTSLIQSRRPKLVAMTQVPTNSGLVQDVASIGVACRAAEVLYLVDACQSVGQMPIDVGVIDCDFLSATTRKFLRGPRGCGFLYVSDRVLEAGMAPLFIDLQGAEWVESDQYRLADDAKRFETWEFAWALVLGAAVAARYAEAIGMEAIRDRARSLATRLRDGLDSIPGVCTLDRGRELCAIVTAQVEGWTPVEVRGNLVEQGINCSASVRRYALLDFDDRNVDGGVRLSPHYFNTESEIDQALEVIARLASHVPSVAT